MVPIASADLVGDGLGAGLRMNMLVQLPLWCTGRPRSNRSLEVTIDFKWSPTSLITTTV